MKSVIFSIYIDIDSDNLKELDSYHGETMSRSLQTKIKLKKYYQKLLQCKQEYAKMCDAEFKLFTADDVYKKFLHSMEPYNIYEFDKINFYKIYLMEQLSHEYDQVLYLDFDVVPRSNASFFDLNNMEKFCIHCISATKQNTWNYLNVQVAKNHFCEEHGCHFTHDHAVKKHLDSYHWYIKKLCKDAMLIQHGTKDDNNLLANTAIMGGGSSAVQSIKFFENLPEMVATFEDVKQEQMMGEEITDKFFINNEVLMTYLMIKNQIDCHYLSSQWHYIQLPFYINHSSKSEAYLWHVVDKQFEKIWGEHV